MAVKPARYVVIGFILIVAFQFRVICPIWTSYTGVRKIFWWNGTHCPIARGGHGSRLSPPPPSIFFSKSLCPSFSYPSASSKSLKSRHFSYPSGKFSRQNGANLPVIFLPVSKIFSALRVKLPVIFLPVNLRIFNFSYLKSAEIL